MVGVQTHSGSCVLLYVHTFLNEMLGYEMFSNAVSAEHASS